MLRKRPESPGFQAVGRFKVLVFFGRLGPAGVGL
jgi:hypothetical protein